MVKNFLIVLKNVSKRVIQKAAEGTGHLTGNKIADKITSKKSISKKLSIEFHSLETNNEIPNERYMSPEKRQQVIDVLRLMNVNLHC